MIDCNMLCREYKVESICEISIPKEDKIRELAVKGSNNSSVSRYGWPFHCKWNL